MPKQNIDPRRVQRKRKIDLGDLLHLQIDAASQMVDEMIDQARFKIEQIDLRIWRPQGSHGAGSSRHHRGS